MENKTLVEEESKYRFHSDDKKQLIVFLKRISKFVIGIFLIKYIRRYLMANDATRKKS